MSGPVVDQGRGRPTFTGLGRVLAFLIGGLWLIDASVGGNGGGWWIIFGPLAWVAAIAGGRFPLLSAALLCVPATILAAHWLVWSLEGAIDTFIPLPLILLVLAAPYLAAWFIFLGRPRR